MKIIRSVHKSAKSHHCQRGAQKCTPPRLVHDSQAQVLEGLGLRAHKRGGEGGVCAPNYSTLRQAISPERPRTSRALRQLVKLSFHILDGEGRIWVQRDWWDFKLFITQTRRVEGLLWNEVSVIIGEPLVSDNIQYQSVRMYKFVSICGIKETDEKLWMNKQII